MHFSFLFRVYGVFFFLVLSPTKVSNNTYTFVRIHTVWILSEGKFQFDLHNRHCARTTETTIAVHHRFGWIVDGMVRLQPVSSSRRLEKLWYDFIYENSAHTYSHKYTHTFVSSFVRSVWQCDTSHWLREIYWYMCVWELNCCVWRNANIPALYVCICMCLLVRIHNLVVNELFLFGWKRVVYFETAEQIE